MKITSVLLLVLGFGFAGFSQDSNDPAILTINGQDFYKSEFLYIYTKNEDNPSFAKDSLRDYMDLFINYKLKVLEAKRLRYDTIPQLVNELGQYRKQLSLPYLTDKDKMEFLIKEAYDRTVNEVRASHILIRVEPNASPADTLAAYNKIMKLRERVLGGEDFGAVAAGPGGSEDPGAKMNGGDLGYFSALQMVYPFEETAYNTKVGEVSMPVRTRFGYHIINVVDKRKARGKITVSHIMIISNDQMSKNDQEKAEQKINEIYGMLENGSSFEELAGKYSEDQTTRAKGGMLPAFGSGSQKRMVPEFEEAAFSIGEDGAFSKPIKTTYGWHIIKRHDLDPIPTFEEMYRELKLKVERDMRAATTKESFINNLKKEYNFKNTGDQYLPMFYTTMDNSIFEGKWEGLEDKSRHGETMFSFADFVYTVQDFENFLLETQVKSRKIKLDEFITMRYEKWMLEELLGYEDRQLESKYPEFKSLIQEYSDGILVFEIMQNEIWTKASKDTAGIKAYFEENRTEYTYPTRYKGELYTCKDASIAKSVREYLKSDTLTYIEIQQLVNEESELNLKVKRQVFNSENVQAFRKGKKKKIRKFKTGVSKPWEFEDEYYVFKVDSVMAPRQREFSEAKGLVTASYQNYLEKKWLEDLRGKYDIVIHEEVLYALPN